MDYFGRQSFSQIYSGQFRPYWLPHNQPGQPPVLVVQVPVPVHMDNNNYDPDRPTAMQKSKSRAQRNRDSRRRQYFLEKKSVCAIMPFHGLEGQDLSSEIQAGADDQQENKLPSKLNTDRASFDLERKMLCSSMPGAELTDKEFRRLFSMPACQPDIAVNDTLVSNLKLADTKIEELQNRIYQLESSNISVQQQHSVEIDQSTETLSFHKFNNELLRLRIADLEEQNRQLQESNKIVNSACERLVGDKEQLTTVVQSCLENLDKYKQRTMDGTSGKGIHGQNEVQQPLSESEQNCEWCCVVRAFYKGVQVDESSSRQSRNFDDRLTDILGELTNPRSSGRAHSANQCMKQAVRSSTQGVVEEKHCSAGLSHDKMGKLNNDNIYERSRGAGHYNAGSPKRQSKSNCDKSVLGARNSQDMNVEFTVTLNLEEDESLEIRDMTSDLPKGGNYVKSKKEVEEDSSTDNSTDISDIKELDSVDGLCNHKDKSSKKSEKGSEKKDKDSKKRRFRKMIGRPLRRSQSAGCESDLQVPEHALFLGEKFDLEKDENSGGHKRLIHKTTSADAAMMAAVLPVDPSDLGSARSKPKTSLAKNVKRKLQALRRRNTDSSLGVTIMKLHGPAKITQADTIEWSKSFESLLSDKIGLDLFRDFLKSEFSDENIEFWIACEEFKTTRTNKLAQKAEQIYTDYVAVKAPKQVNLDSKTRLETVTNLDNPTRDMYKSAQKRIQHLMEKDPYPRFLESEIFLQLSRQSSRSDSR